MKENNMRRMVLTAIMIAVVTVGTIAIRVPTPTGGYVNLGDGFILVTSYFLGPVAGVLAGALGSAGADLIGGYFTYAPFTFVIKGLIALPVGLTVKNTGRNLTGKVILAAIISEIIMIFGYYLTNSFFMGSLKNGIVSIPGDSVQGLFGVLIFAILVKALEAAKIEKYLV